MSSCGRRRPRVFPVVVGFVLGIAPGSVGPVPGAGLSDRARGARLGAAVRRGGTGTPGPLAGARARHVRVSGSRHRDPPRRAARTGHGLLPRPAGRGGGRRGAPAWRRPVRWQSCSLIWPPPRRPPLRGRGSATPLVSTTAARPVATSRWSLRVAAGAAWGSSDGVTLEPMAGAGWSPSPRVRLGIDLGFGATLPRRPRRPPVAVVDSVPLRAGVGFALGGGRLEAGAALRAYRAHAASSQLGLREGAFVAATWMLPRLVLVASLRLGRRRPLAPQAGSAGRRTERPNRRVAGALAGCWACNGARPGHEGRRLADSPSPRRRSDEAMVARAMTGDRRAFDELYQRHVDSVWRWLTRLLGADPEREDLAQHIFSEVFDTLGRFRGEARFRTFLYRIVVNVAVDQMKRRTRRAKRDVAASWPKPCPTRPNRRRRTPRSASWSPARSSSSSDQTEEARGVPAARRRGLVPGRSRGDRRGERLHGRSAGAARLDRAAGAAGPPRREVGRMTRIEESVR